MEAKNDTCPNCGYCPHCGRGGHQTTPWWPYPNYPWYPTGQPWFTSPWWQTTGGGNTIGIGGTGGNTTGTYKWNDENITLT